MLAFHIAGGAVALIAGAVALLLQKGGRGHARAGKTFFASMMVLFVSGAGMAVLLSLWNVALGAGFGIYLIATSWATARRRDGKTGPFELYAFLAVSGCAIADLIMGLVAMGSATVRLFGYSPTPFFIFAGMAALAAGLDLNFILRRGASPAQRI